MDPTTSTAAAAPRAAGFSIRRLWPLALLGLAIGTFFALDLDMYLTFEALRANRATLTTFVAEHAVWASLLYMALYAAAVAMSLPGGAVLTIAGGFLFGTVLGTVQVVIAATVGATLLFLIAKTALADFLKAKAGPFLQRMEAGFQENAFSYLLVLRLIPLFPFFIVNLVPAFLGVGLRTYVLGTFIGIIPGSFVFTSVGAGLGSLFDRSETFSPGSVLTPEIVTALVGLALLALLPVVYRKIKARRAAEA
ncbi:MAG: TVP38/TMEM64 family protein [Nitrospirota bacterium]|nr:TVP38/TMEM64 family protein [Nitrospirota bacterium]